MKMNFFKYAAVALLGGMVLFTSCEKDSEFDDPKVKIEQGSAFELDPSQGPVYELSLDASIVAPGVIDKIVVERTKLLNNETVDQGEYIFDGEHVGVTETDISYGDFINYEPFFDGTIDKIEYLIVVTDKEGNIGDAMFTVTMGGYTALDIEFTEGEIWNIYGSGKGCWNLKDDLAVSALGDGIEATRYMINTDAEGSTDKNFPFTGSWSSVESTWISSGGNTMVTKGNGTEFVKANGYDYEKAPRELALHLFENGEATTFVEAPEADDIYIAKLEDELYVIKIIANDTEVDPNSKLNNGVLRFSYKK